ncbi:sugar kinase [Labilithrix luteola]|uniref:sugar kinase n=1 Tax=Labilithrix luteola TaxID=1391654 RepID=UPI000AA832A1|nr:sugar kinase [Labilithrix luteola]
MKPIRTLAFGELLLRLSPPGHERLLQSPSLNATFGGGEANVAISLAHFGVDSHFVTRLPPNPVGDAALRVLRAEGVGIDAVQRGGERMGIYFVEAGASQRPWSIAYDRAHSAISELDPSSLDWPKLLRDVAWFHTSGITPALGPGPAESTRRAVQAARELGVTVSLDFNYRRMLWSASSAKEVLPSLVRYVDVLFAGEDDLRTFLGIPIPHGALDPASLDLRACETAAARVVSEYGVRQLAITLRENLSASHNGWSALLYDGPSKTLHRGPRHVVHLVDRIGAGDSFVAGLVFAQLDGKPLDQALRFAVAASALKQTIPGDFNRVSVAEVERLGDAEDGGRVRR